MVKILIFSVLIIGLILIIGWEIHIFRKELRVSDKILFSILPAILFVVFGYILYIGIDNEVYLHSAEANMQTGVDGEYFNLAYRDNKQHTEFLLCDDGSIELDSSVTPREMLFQPEDLPKGWRYRAVKEGEAWVSVWNYEEENANAPSRIENIEIYHLTVDASNNITCEKKDGYLPTIFPSNFLLEVFPRYGDMTVVIAKGNNSVEITDVDQLKSFYRKFHLAFGENYWSNPYMPDGSEYHLVVYYYDRIQCDFYITEDGHMYGKYEDWSDYAGFCVLDDPERTIAQKSDVEFVPDESSPVEDIRFMLDDLLTNN